MAKVITSAGLNEFISTGKHEDIKADPKPKPVAEAPPLEVKTDKPVADLKVTESKDLSAEDLKALVDENPEIADDLSKSERVRRAVNKYYREKRQIEASESKLKEEAAESERLAESQFNRARLAEQKLAEYEQKIKELEAKAAPPKEQPKPKPDPQKYYDDKGQFKAFEYAEDLAAWSADQKVAEYATKQEEARRAVEAAEAERLARIRVAEAEKKHPDYREVIETADVKTHQAVLDYLTASEQIGEVGYYMAKHPEFVERINKLHPLKAIAEVGKLELTFETQPEAPKAPVPPPQAVSGAPPPIVPLEVSRSVEVQTDPAKMDFKQLRAYERARAKKR